MKVECLRSYLRCTSGVNSGINMQNTNYAPLCPPPYILGGGVTLRVSLSVLCGAKVHARSGKRMRSESAYAKSQLWPGLCIFLYSYKIIFNVNFKGYCTKCNSMYYFTQYWYKCRFRKKFSLCFLLLLFHLIEIWCNCYLLSCYKIFILYLK